MGENVRNIVTYSIDNIKAQNCALEFHTFCFLDNLVLSLDILVALWYLNWPERCSGKLKYFYAGIVFDNIFYFVDEIVFHYILL